MKKIIKNEDLRNVNGGVANIDKGDTSCPKCDSDNYDTTSKGSGCDFEYHHKCRDCGTEWVSH